MTTPYLHERYLCWDNDMQLVGHWQQGTSSNSPHIIVNILQTSQYGIRQEGKKNAREILRFQSRRKQ